MIPQVQELPQITNKSETAMICFWNPGVFDLRLLSTFGASAKPEAPHPIGRFGSGLKHAIAGVYRLGGKVEIHSDGVVYQIVKREMTVRGKVFEQLVLESGTRTELLPFVSDLGSHWSPWMIYREFYSNALDENGGVGEYEDSADTWIRILDCPEISEVDQNREKYLIQDPAECSTLDSTGVIGWLKDTPAEVLFYRGIRASNPEGKRAWALHWSIEKEVPLSEDRLFSSMYATNALITDALLMHGTRDLWHALAAQNGSPLELELEFSSSTVVPNQAFKDFWLGQLTEKKTLPFYVKEALRKFAPEAVSSVETPDPLTASWEDLERAEPEKSAKPAMWSIFCDMDSHVEDLQAQVTYWKTLAKKLTRGEA